MKKTVILTILLLSAVISSSLGQDNQSGTIIYEEIVKIDIKLEGEMAHLMKDMPKEQRSKKVLCFSPEASVYSNKKADSNAGDHAEMGGISIMMGMPENIIFLDILNKELIEQREFMTRMFLIEGEIPSTEWKITGQQKMILDYPCMEATSKDTSGLVTRAWFTPTIPVQTGPGKFFSLPGLVMEVDINDGQRVILAESISFDSPEKDLLKRPKEGKKVTKAEFDKIVEEKVKEMGGEGGASSGGTIMIKIKH